MSESYYSKPEDFEDMQVYIDKVEEAKKTGIPVAVQALWDGDTQGWFVYLEVIFLEDAPSTYSIIDLCAMRFASDLRIFNGQTTPWEETIIAKKIGNYISKKYDIPFWFPASEAPDDDCPSWLQRDKGINCADCNKLIIPTDSPYLPKDICYSCNLERESKEEFSNDIATNDELTIYILNADTNKSEFKSYWLMTQSKDKGIYKEIATILDERNIKIEEIENYNLFKEDLEKLLSLYENKLKLFFDNYDIEKVEKFLKQDYLIEVEYKGKNYLLHTFFNRELIGNMDTVKTIQSVIDENKYFYLFFAKNKTRQLDTIMRFIKEKKTTTLQKLIHYYSQAYNEKYRTALSKEQINKNIQRLIDRDYISIDENDIISLTFKGNFY